MAKKFLLVDTFKGYKNKRDDTKQESGVLITGSKNVRSTDGENVKIREGFTLFGSANSSNNPIESSFDWQANTNVERNLRSYDDELEVYDSIKSNDWVRVADGWSAVDFNYAYWWDADANLDMLIFVNGDTNIYVWSGGMAEIGVTTGSTIQLLDTATTWAEQRFISNPGTPTVTYDKKLVINGTEYTYTGGETTNTLTGVTPDPSGEASGSLAVQSVTTKADAPGSDSTVFSNDLIRVLNNHVWVGSLKNNNIFMSKNSDFTDFTFSSPRVPGEGAILTLDGSPTGFIEQEQNMYISASKDQWYKIVFQLSADNTAETLVINRLKTTAQEAAQSQGLIGKIKNSVIYVSFEPTLDTLGRLENLDTPQSKALSDSIKKDFDSYDFTGGDIIYHRNRFYITAPNDSILLEFNLERGFWEAPHTLPAGKLSIIDSELYLHSNATAETYKLFDGSNDNENPINGIARFSYMNYGDRVALKQFDEWYSEGRISSNTSLTLGIDYDFGGFTSKSEYEIKGSDSAILFQPTIDNSLGKNSLGKQPLGTTSDSPPEIAKFRQIDTMINEDFFEIAIQYSSNEVDYQWEILAFGGNIKSSTNEPIEIKK